MHRLSGGSAWRAPVVAWVAGACALLAGLPAFAADAAAGWMVAGIPFEFFLFATTLICVALFHNRTFEVAISGLVVIALYKIAFAGFKTGPGIAGFVAHLGHEWVILVNLLCLLVGFAILSNHFEKSEVPAILPKYLPDDWKGPLVLLAMVFVLSSFLDNIAAALIGGAMAHTVFRGKVHIGYLAAIVAASNAGGSGSVVGDTTTTMMWIDGVSPVAVLDAYVAALVAFVVFAIPAAFQQHRLQPIMRDAPAGLHIDWARVGIVALILVFAIVTNVSVNLTAPHLADLFPFLGAAVWAAIIITIPVRKPDWSLVPGAVKGTVFLLALVTCASMMPVEHLPAASWPTTLSLGFISAVFDNIPLTALALKQGGYDWGMLAYAVGFGGSMIWFGSSAGVALSNMYPEAKSVGRWIVAGWYIPVAYVIGFIVMLAVTGWHPSPKKNSPVAPVKAAQVLPGASAVVAFPGARAA